MVGYPSKVENNLLHVAFPTTEKKAQFPVVCAALFTERPQSFWFWVVSSTREGSSAGPSCPALPIEQYELDDPMVPEEALAGRDSLQSLWG